MNSPKNIVVKIIVLSALLIIIWQWLEHETNIPAKSSLTERDLNLRSTFENKVASNSKEKIIDSSVWSRRVDARKGAEDIDSVVSTFKESYDCMTYHMARRDLDSMLNGESLDNLSNETIATLKRIDSESERLFSIVSQTKDRCIGSDEKALKHVYIEALMEAALRGSPDAQSCFVLTGPYYPENSDPSYSREFWERKYLENAPKFTREALERGDPRVAKKALFQYIASPPVHPSNIDALAKADPYLARRTAGLALRRATSESRKHLEYIITEFDKRGFLSAADTLRADSWAENAYQRNFAGQPLINIDTVEPCYSNSELAP